LLVYATGTLLSPRWRWVAWTTVLIGVTLAIVGGVGSWQYRGRALLSSIEEIGPELRWASILIGSR
jgi:hypothetical protein